MLVCSFATPAPIADEPLALVMCSNFPCRFP